MKLAASNAMSPAPTPRTRWLKATEDVFEAPRASGPKRAEENINRPLPTRRTSSIASGLSTLEVRLDICLYRRERKYNRKNPVTHDYFIRGPSDGFKVMM